MLHGNLQMPTPKYHLLVIVGPTASGKTALAIELARKLNGEIICADSRTVYKYMDIGTAKPSRQEQAAVRHHLIDVIKPDEPFTVADFKKLALQAIEDINKRGKLPIMVGGSGLYVDSVIFDYDFAGASGGRDSVNPRHRAPEAEHAKSPLREGTFIIGLNPGREMLKQKLTARVDKMVENGFVEEVAMLHKKYPSAKALDAPGYRAFSDYLRGEIDLNQAKAAFATRDYQLAKRQMTWFKRNPNIRWFDSAESALFHLL